MNWKTVAADQLRDYYAKKQAEKNLPLQITALEDDMASIRGARIDGTPVRGGGSGREDMLLSNIVKREELTKNLYQVKHWLIVMENALSVLTSEEQQILDRFYILSERGAADRLANDLGVDTKTIYRRKDQALRKFTLALYGCTEL